MDQLTADGDAGGDTDGGSHPPSRGRPFPTTVTRAAANQAPRRAGSRGRSGQLSRRRRRQHINSCIVIARETEGRWDGARIINVNTPPVSIGYISVRNECKYIRHEHQYTS